jgi:hypothetical protein
MSVRGLHDMYKTLIIIGLVLLCAVLSFGSGYIIGGSNVGKVRDAVIAEHRGQLDQLGRDLDEARRASQSVREGIAAAQGAIVDSAGRLEDSLAGIGRLGSVTAQIRGLAAAIRGHVAALREATLVLEAVLPGADGFTALIDTPVE